MQDVNWTGLTVAASMPRFLMFQCLSWKRSGDAVETSTDPATRLVMLRRTQKSMAWSPSDSGHEVTILLPLIFKQDSAGLPEMVLMKAHESSWTLMAKMSPLSLDCVALLHSFTSHIWDHLRRWTWMFGRATTMKVTTATWRRIQSHLPSWRIGGRMLHRWHRWTRWSPISAMKGSLWRSSESMGRWTWTTLAPSLRPSSRPVRSRWRCEKPMLVVHQSHETPFSLLFSIVFVLITTITTITILSLITILHISLAVEWVVWLICPAFRGGSRPFLHVSLGTRGHLPRRSAPCLLADLLGRASWSGATMDQSMVIMDHHGSSWENGVVWDRNHQGFGASHWQSLKAGRQHFYPMK